MAKIHIYTDGGSRGNPGPSALGVYITDEKGKVIEKIGIKLGITTNNIAEYSAILAGFTYVLENKEKINPESINFFMDSQLAYSQLIGIYKIKNDGIRKLMFEIRKKEAELNIPIFYAHIPREQNKRADELATSAIKNKTLY